MFILLFSILIALVIVVFAVQNAAIVPVQFFIWSTDLPFVLVIFCSVFAGALLMFCLALWRDLKKKMKKRSNASKSTVIVESDQDKKVEATEATEVTADTTPKNNVADEHSLY